MRSPKGTVDVAIVGGGLAGVTAAALLAKAGRSVALFEKVGRMGGRAITTVDQGFHFNLGPHAWYVAGRATDIVRSLGVQIHGRQPTPSGAYALYQGGVYTLPIGLVSMVTSSLLSLRGKMEVARAFASIQRVNTSALDGISVSEWLQDVASDPVARELLSTLLRTATYVYAPEVVSAGAALTQMKLTLAGNVWYLDGGWQRLVDDISAVATSHGARLLSGHRVREVIIESGRVRAIHLDEGDVVEATDVIVATPPKFARELVKSGGVAAWQTLTANVATLDLGLTRLPNPATKFAVGIDRALYYSVHSATALVAPEGQALVHVAKYLDPMGQSDAKRDEAELEGVMDLLQPGWRTHVVARRFLPSMAVTHGVPTAREGGLGGRPAVVVDRIAGLYLAGDWVGAEGQLANAAVSSAARAVDSIVQQRSRHAA
jgi:phytoene dehydrogenase-like protein